MRFLLAFFRVFGVVLHLSWGAWKVKFVFPRITEVQRRAQIEDWSRTMLRRLGIGLRTEGTAATHGPVLMASNHISWLDIGVIHAARHCRFVSKSEVRHWPLVGLLATGVGTLYIERASRRDAMRVVHQMAERLQAGDVLAIFPEGTTGDGTTVLPFHGNLLQAAISAGAPVQPVALRFVDQRTGQISLAPCYIGDDTLVMSLWRTLCAQHLQAVVCFGELQTADGRDRRIWATDLREQIIGLRAGTTP
jgi:1-acyl-sn-glycerol-3-phosphate acyltransferase